MRNYECGVCHGLCDPGELIGNTCVECREKERLETVSQEKARKILSSPFKQMEFEFEAKKDVI